METDRWGQVWLILHGGYLGLPDYLRSEPILAVIEARGAARPESSLLWGADFFGIGWLCIMTRKADGGTFGRFTAVLALMKARGATDCAEILRTWCVAIGSLASDRIDNRLN